MNKNEYAFVIPAYNPDKKLIELIKNIREGSSKYIFIIDDGSCEESQIIFDTLEKICKNDHKIVLLRHAVNLGKGASLKTIFNYILVTHKNIAGIVTLDSDGQHSVKDCMRVLNALEEKPNAFVLGYRTFSKEIPLKSYLGNNISKFIYKLVLGKSFKDTQTGLRGLSKELMKKCLKIKSNRFEFETEQLAIVAKENISIEEIPIETIYIENNKASSFRPLVDSFKIYFILFRYGLASVITAVSDFIVFMLALSMGASVFGANMIARTVSICVQYILLEKYVFASKSSIRNFLLFAVYVYIMGAVSASTQIYLTDNLSFSIILAKVLVEGILFFINFAFLRLYIFTTREK